MLILPENMGQILLRMPLNLTRYYDNQATWNGQNNTIWTEEKAKKFIFSQKFWNENKKPL